MLNLPTDNLYKFLAIFGLVILIFSVYYLFQKSRELSLLSIEVENGLKITEQQGHHLKNKGSLLISLLDNYKAKFAIMEEGQDKEKVFDKLQKTYDDYYQFTLK